MYPVLALVLATWLVTLMEGLTSQYSDLKQLYQSRSRQLQLTLLAKNIEQYSIEKNAFPPSVGITTPTNNGDLSNTTGFEHTRSLLNNWQGYAVTSSISTSSPNLSPPILNDSFWLFQRMVLFSFDPSTGMIAADYIGVPGGSIQQNANASANNKCKGNGGPLGNNNSFYTDSSWCGLKSSKWFRLETRENYNIQILTQRIRFNRLLQKLAQYYNTNTSFPDKDHGNNPLTLSTAYALTALAAGSSTTIDPKNCSNQYTLLGVPIDCSDMFDLWGNPISYQFISSTHIILVSETPIYNYNSNTNSSNRIVIGAEYDYSQL